VKYLWILVDSTFLKSVVEFQTATGMAQKGGLLFGLCLLIRILGFNFYKIDSVKWNSKGGVWLVGVSYIDIFMVIFLGRLETEFDQCKANMENQSIKLFMLRELYRTRDNKFSCKMY
jgi:hypothetical protein